jgi:hypothetical protein
VPERILWLLGIAAGAILLAAAFWPRIEDQAPVAPAPSPVPLAPAVRVEILNGCGVSQVAARLTRKARSLGLDVIHEGNASSFEFLHTLVIDRSGDLDQARRVADLLGIPHLVQQQIEDPYRLAEVSIVIGRDYRRIELLD